MTARKESDLCVAVRRAVSDYLRLLDGEKPGAVYDMVLQSVERPLLEVILDNAQGNQTRAAEILGMNRNTLRKKLQQYGLSNGV